MGLISAVLNAAGGVVADQWKEYFYCDSLPADTLVVKASKRTSGRGGSNNKGEDNVISNGSVIAVADGQCMIITDQGKVVEVCAEPGEFVYDTSSEPSIFTGKLGDSIKETFKKIGRRITFAGNAAREQRVYYVNTKEIIGNKYGTANPVPFRVVDRNIGLDIDIAIRCNGEYSYHIVDPILFYTNVTGNISSAYDRGQIDSQLKSELMTALQPAFARISEMGVRYSAVPAHTTELADALNAELSGKWRELRGIEIVSFGVNTLKASEEDEKMIKELQKNAVLRDPTMAAATLTGAQAAAMQQAASNTSAGPMMAFAGMNMANMAGGMNAQGLYQMGAAQQAAAQQQAAQPQQTAQQTPPPQAPEPQNPQMSAPSQTAKDGWFCTECGAKNQGKFCQECGAKKPAGALQYKCDKCGWTPEDPTKPPKFCPECGDPFRDEDIVR